MLTLVLSIELLLAATASGVSKLEVEIENLRTDRGVIGVVVFDRDDGFPTKGERARFRSIIKPKRGRATATFTEVPIGAYAVAVVHDENENGTLDTSWLGMPKEGYGASNNPPPRLGPPRFGDARFLLKGPRQVVKILVMYP